jgi:hydroxyacylglutathione hydrolase
MLMNDTAEHRIETIQAGGANVYLIANGGQSILVDAGNKGAASKILEELRQSGLEPEDVKLIILTHTHYDHVGSLKEIQEVTQAKILVHESEAENLSRGYGGFPRGTMLLGKLVSFIGRNLARGSGRFEAVRPDTTISERFDLEPYGMDGYVLPTPGHSPGSVCVIVDGETAIVGDTLFGISRRTAFPPFADDVDELLRSWKRLIETGCQRFLPGHGGVISLETLRESYEKARSKRLPV